MNKKKKDFEPYFGSFVLETLTTGMYGEARMAIREYVQNAYDSILSAIQAEVMTERRARVDVVIDRAENFVSIRDNGMGIKKLKAVETLTNIGASSKNYKNQAGFRGIGRLSGLVMCDKLIFRTKASGENTETVVEFAAAGLRRDLSPARAPTQSLTQILKKHISAYEEDAEDVDAHFFEVRMQGMYEPPVECINADEMIKYLAQVAPVPYSESFDGARKILGAASRYGQPIEQIKVFVHTSQDDKSGIQVFKPYGETFRVQATKVPLTDVEIVESKTGLWWGWIGRKSKSGAYKDDVVKGIRVRVRNIQIDGAQVMTRIFAELEEAASYVRFNDWYVGEVFADPEKLIPNARRDGFEELPDWITARRELSDICRNLGKDAYLLSKRSQGDITQLGKLTKRITDEVTMLIGKDELDITEISKTITDIEKALRKVNRATQEAESSIAGQLKTLEARLLQAHRKTLAKIKVGTGALSGTPEFVARAQREIVLKLIDAFNDEFDRKSFAQIMEVIERVTGIVE